MLKYGDQCWHVHDNNSLFREWDKERRDFYKRPGAVMHTVFAFAPSKKPNEEPGTKRLDKRTCDIKKVAIISGVDYLVIALLLEL